MIGSSFHRSSCCFESYLAYEIEPLDPQTGSVEQKSAMGKALSFVVGAACNFDKRCMGWDTIRRHDGSLTKSDHGGKWEVCQTGENGALIHVAEVIDATGRAACFARLAGAKKHSVDHLIGVAAYFHGLDRTSTTHTTFVEAEEYGWWYGALLPDCKSVIMFMTDPMAVKLLGLNEWPNFYDRALNTRHVSGFIAAFDPIERLHIHSANSQRIR